VAASEASPFDALEQRAGGRLGVFALDTHSGREWALRADERFALCSTFKWLLAACVLARVDRAELALDTRVSFGAADLLQHAPVCREHVAAGALSIEALARAAVVLSDNTAANLLLARLGGPAGLTQFCRSLGDETTRLDRYEESLNENTPGDERDTSTPRAMVKLLERVLCPGPAARDVLSSGSRERLLGWLRESPTGKARLRAGLPASWNAGDKTGTGQRGACNDVAIAFPPGRAPLLLAVYLSDGPGSLEVLQSVHADVARHIAADYGAAERSAAARP
jgi:beta-lactamase class A